MLDPALRRLIDPPLDIAGRWLAALGVSANTVTLGGFVLGLAALPLLAAGRYGEALAAILLNRLADGLDGAIARNRGSTDLGGYLDILCDFLVYAAVVFGFVLVEPQNRLPGAFLLFAFVGTGTSFLAFAALAAQRGWQTEIRGRKAIYYLGGLTEGSETIALFVVICIMPGSFPILAWLFGAACWLTTFGRVFTAWRLLQEPSTSS